MRVGMLRVRVRTPYHCNQGVLVDKVSQHGHLLMKVVLPHFSYPSLVVASTTHVGCDVICAEAMLRLTVLLLRVQAGGRGETHTRRLAPQSRLRAESAVEAGAYAHDIAVDGERADLCVGVEVGGVVAQRRAVRSGMALRMGRELLLMIR